MKESILALIKNTSANLPKDVETALRTAHGREKEGSSAWMALDGILRNVEIARRKSVPLCQDTGQVNFFVTHPPGVRQDIISDALKRAVKEAVKTGCLRPNAVDPLSGKNTGTGVGPGSPGIHFSVGKVAGIKIDLLLKGGGSENVSAQYSLPDTDLNAYRDMDGVKKCVIDAVFRAQGNGCAPGIIGVGIGGDRAGSYMIAKKQLLRKLGDTNKVGELKAMEEELYRKINLLGIGPMGLGGETTVLGVKIGALSRVPASFFVSVAYMCWALRRGSVTIRGGI